MKSREMHITLYIDGGEWSTPHSGRFNPEKQTNRSAAIQDAGWARRPFGTGAQNLAPTGIRSPFIDEL